MKSEAIRRNKVVSDLLEEIIMAAQEHPLFMGWKNEIDYSDAESVGGDAAFITLDIAWKAKEALEALRGNAKQDVETKP